MKTWIEPPFPDDLEKSRRFDAVYDWIDLRCDVVQSDLCCLVVDLFEHGGQVRPSLLERMQGRVNPAIFEALPTRYAIEEAGGAG